MNVAAVGALRLPYVVNALLASQIPVLKLQPVAGVVSLLAWRLSLGIISLTAPFAELILLQAFMQRFLKDQTFLSVLIWLTSVFLTMLWGLLCSLAIHLSRVTSALIPSPCLVFDRGCGVGEELAGVMPLLIAPRPPQSLAPPLPVKSLSSRAGAE